jgi:hypothetical protein
MRRRSLTIFLCLLLVLGLGAALTACGGGGGDSSSGGAGTAGGSSKVQVEPREAQDPPADEAEIEAAIVASVEEKDPANCTRIEAPGFLEQTTGRSGAEALAACEEEARAEAGKPPRETVSVGSVEAIGESAAATATISGGSLDGQTVEIALRKEGGRWRLGRLVGFEGFDKATFVAAVGAVLGEEGGEAAAARTCVEKGLAKLPDSELEDSILTGGAPRFQQAFEACR